MSICYHTNIEKKIVTLNVKANVSLSILLYRFSALIKVLDTIPIVVLVLSGITCERTAGIRKII